MCWKQEVKRCRVSSSFFSSGSLLSYLRSKRINWVGFYFWEGRLFKYLWSIIVIQMLTNSVLIFELVLISQLKTLVATLLIPGIISMTFASLILLRAFPIILRPSNCTSGVVVAACYLISDITYFTMSTTMSSWVAKHS